MSGVIFVLLELAGIGDIGTFDPSSTRHAKRWETTKLVCRHLDKTKPEKLVTQKKHAQVRTGSGLSQKGHGRDTSSSSHELHLDPRAEVVSGKHSIFTSRRTEIATIFPGNLQRSETNGIADRAMRRIEETFAVLLQSCLDEKWWADSLECYCYVRNVQDLL